MNLVVQPPLRFLPRGTATGPFLLTVVLFALAVRLAGARGELWLDEIWSLEQARHAATPAAVLTDLKSDNNHPLNTWYLQAVGPDRSPWVYRLPAIACGTLAVAVAFAIARPWGDLEAVLAATLQASSYALIHYTSEARGYAPALTCMLIGWFALSRFWRTRAWTWATVLWGSSILGLLAHPIFVPFLGAVSLWSALVLAPRDGLRSAARDLAALFGLPAIMTLALFVAHWSTFDLGGGPPFHWTRVLAQSASLSVGGPIVGPGLWLTAATAAAIVAGCSWRLREDSHATGFGLALVVIAPLAMAVVVRPPFLFPRYFLPALAAMPFCTAVVLAHGFRAERRFPRYAAAAGLMLLLAGNLRHTAELVTIGRGQCRAALAHLAERSPPGEILVSSDHNFGIGKLVAFHAPHIPSGERIRYCNGDRWPPTGPDWLILHRAKESAEVPPASRLSIDRHHFELDRVFDATILSGWQWWCYRRSTTARQAVRLLPEMRTDSFVGRVSAPERPNDSRNDGSIPSRSTMKGEGARRSLAAVPLEFRFSRKDSRRPMP